MIKGIFFDVSEDKSREFKSILGKLGHKQRVVLEAAIDDYIKKKGGPSWYRQ